jgi:hypothetical protein
MTADEIHWEQITEPAAWVGEDLMQNTSWIQPVLADQVAELDAALRHVKQQGLEIPFAREDFPLNGLAAVLGELPQRLEEGAGCVLLRGFPRRRYTDDECEIIYWGIASHLGTPISQNTRGHLVGHVRDEGRSFDDPTARGYQTSAKMDFHADQLPVDVLGLFCLRTAKSGGASALVSALTIHNILARERPDLLEVLYQPFNLDWRGEEAEGESPWYRSPMFSARQGRVTSRFTSRQYFESVTRYDPALALSDIQREALDLVQELANRPDLRLRMEFQEGDMQFLNNHVLLHAREAFEDHDDPDRKRHLLRLWVALPPGVRRPLSPALAERYRVVEQGGIPVRA